RSRQRWNRLRFPRSWLHLRHPLYTQQARRKARLQRKRSAFLSLATTFQRTEPVKLPCLVPAVKTRQTSSFSAGPCRISEGDETNLIPFKVGRERREVCANSVFFA